MIRYYRENIRDRRSLFLVFIFIVELLVLCGCKSRKISKEGASQLFRQYILDPIPKSVTNIRADQPKKILGYKYTFRFNINRDDLALLIDSRHFMRVWNVKYKNGYLYWGWDRDGPLGISKVGNSIELYVAKNSRPDWFRLELWENPEAYAFMKEGDLVNIETFDKKSSGPNETRVLLYNEKEAEAYFVVSYWER